MNKKKLPRAVTQTADEMRKAGATTSISPAGEAGSNVAADGRNATAPKKRTKLPEIIDPAQELATGPRPAASGDRQRLSQASAIVERYANLAAIGGIIPLPLINVAGVTVIILRMVKRLCELYGVPYEHGRARALVVSLAAGAVPTTAATVTSSTLVYFIPGVNLLGLAVSSVTASACARAVGNRFVQHFDSGASLIDFPVIDRRKMQQPFATSQSH